MNGSEVSVHYDLFKLAKAKDWPVILAVGHNFYKYLPADIERESRLNERDGVTMINFSIRAGESLQKKPEQIPTHPVLEKLKSELQAEEVKWKDHLITALWKTSKKGNLTHLLG